MTSDVVLFGSVGSRGVQDYVSLSECACLTCLPPPAFSEVAPMGCPWKRNRFDVWLCKLGTLSSVFQVAVVLVRFPCQPGVMPVECCLIHFVVLLFAGCRSYIVSKVLNGGKGSCGVQEAVSFSRLRVPTVVVCSCLQWAMCVNTSCEARGFRVTSYKSPRIPGPTMVSSSAC